MDDFYFCRKCNEEWNFHPEDYDYIEEDYPEICPLCSMPITQMIKDVYKEEGVLGAIRQLWKRLI